MPPVLEARVYYALKCLVCLAESDAPRRAKELALTTGIPPSETAKILYQLTWAGLISSRRGPTGGFWLRRPATEIRVRDVTAFFHPPDEDDSPKPQDSILRVWEKKGGSIHPDFENLSLAELVKESHRILGPSDRAGRGKAPDPVVTKSLKRTTARRNST